MLQSPCGGGIMTKEHSLIFGSAKLLTKCFDIVEENGTTTLFLFETNNLKMVYIHSNN